MAAQGSSAGHEEASAEEARGNVVVTGRFRGAVDFGGGALNSAGGWGVFVVKLEP